MADIVNLNQFRKKRDRHAAEQRANRSRFGQTKDTRNKTAREAEKVKKELDDKRLE